MRPDLKDSTVITDPGGGVRLLWLQIRLVPCAAATHASCPAAGHLPQPTCGSPIRSSKDLRAHASVTHPPHSCVSRLKHMRYKQRSQGLFTRLKYHADAGTLQGTDTVHNTFCFGQPLHNGSSVWHRCGVGILLCFLPKPFSVTDL